jgi:ribose/xylose/arabinose/galactoside ABC-type transport system permease subunit
VVAYLVLQKTTFGRSVYATGANPTAARLAGIATNRVVVLVFVISGVLAGFAGVVTAAWLNVGDSAFHGKGIELDSIAAVAVGGALLGGGKGSVVGTVAGVLIIGFLQNIMNLLQLPGDLQYVAVGLVIVGAVALQQVRRRA